MSCIQVSAPIAKSYQCRKWAGGALSGYQNRLLRRFVCRKSQTGSSLSSLHDYYPWCRFLNLHSPPHLYHRVTTCAQVGHYLLLSSAASLQHRILEKCQLLALQNYRRCKWRDLLLVSDPFCMWDQHAHQIRDFATMSEVLSLAHSFLAALRLVHQPLPAILSVHQHYLYYLSLLLRPLCQCWLLVLTLAHFAQSEPCMRPWEWRWAEWAALVFVWHLFKSSMPSVSSQINL